jgi:hypothetical protein
MTHVTVSLVLGGRVIVSLNAMIARQYLKNVFDYLLPNPYLYFFYDYYLIFCLVIPVFDTTPLNNTRLKPFIHSSMYMLENLQ